MELEIVGLVIKMSYRNAFAVEVKFGDDEEVAFKMEEPYAVRHANQSCLMNPAIDDGDRIQSCFKPLYGVEIESAIAEGTGELRLKFVDGSSLDCGPSEMYEPWAYYGPRGVRVWSLAGGRLMICRSRLRSSFETIGRRGMWSGC